MKAYEIRIGDRFEGNNPYTVEDTWEEVIITERFQNAEVRFDCDGGNAYRRWCVDDEVPLVRPGWDVNKVTPTLI